MKAFLLAGGRGERLRPLTLSMPKCLVPVDREPILGIWLDLLARAGVSEVLVNVSQFPEQVAAFLASRSRRPRVTLVPEPTPIGNAGTVAANRQFVEHESDFWILYSDNLTTVDLARIERFHRSHQGILTLGLFEAPDPRQAGIVSLDAAGCILQFDEKPEHPASTLANAGIYLARRELLDRIPTGEPIVDFGMHVFPRLVGRLFGCPIEGLHVDIGTPQGLARATALWAAQRHGASLSTGAARRPGTVAR
ncbi:MAG: NDP-sugar synthase [Vicinamibacterales bacterium]